MLAPKIGERVFHTKYGEGIVKEYDFYSLTHCWVFFYSKKKMIKVKNSYLSETYKGSKAKEFTNNIKFGLNSRLG